MPRDDYYQIQAQKAERYQELAEKAENKSNSLFKSAHDMAECIPFGQPILVGHHSEKRDRNFRERIGRTFEKSMEENDKAKYYAGKAARAESPTAISSDAPDAIELLKEKLTKLETNRDRFKAINKIILSRRKDYTKDQKVQDLIKQIGISEKSALGLFEPDCCGRIGIPNYMLTNDGASIREIKKRIELLEKNNQIPTSEYMIGDIRIVDSAEDNRVIIFFPSIPDQDMRKKLKSCGFRWSPTAGAWQAYRTNKSRSEIKYLFPGVDH